MTEFANKLHPFFALLRAQRAGISEVLTKQHRRVLRVADASIVEVHKELLDKKCSVFQIDETDTNMPYIQLIVPEGARDAGRLLSQPMDAAQYRDVLVTIGRTLKDVHTKTGWIPSGEVTDTLAVAFDPDSADPQVFLVPPYSLVTPDSRTITPELFTSRLEWQEPIWEGWNDLPL